MAEAGSDPKSRLVPKRTSGVLECDQFMIREGLVV